MADDKHYVPGDFYRICDRTGFKVRANNTNMEWNNLIVRDKSWEPRQPQDFVRGVADEQYVPDPRPRGLDTFVGPLQTMLTANLPAGGFLWTVELTTRMQSGDAIEVVLDNGDMFRTTIVMINSTTVLQAAAPAPSQASSGALVTDITAYSNPNIG